MDQIGWNTWMESHWDEAFALLLELAQIPAPSNREEKRAEFCKSWLKKQGVDDVYIDEALNVIVPVGCSNDNDLIAILAHSDVVFPDTEPLPLRIEQGRVYCPGVGDDTASVVALLMAAKYIVQHQLVPEKRGVLLVINAGEEGLGNLKGVRKLMQDFGHRVRELIAIDSHENCGVNRAVGSQRYRIAVDTEGGHSYGDFGNRNAIVCLASLIDTLYAVKVPEKGKTTYNVGTISGGTSVNTIAQHAEMLYEFRSDEGDSLRIMEKHLAQAVESCREKGWCVTVTSVGERPCSGAVDMERMQEMMDRANRVALRHYGKEIAFGSGSTDCNIPLAMGIPAICVGCYRGAGAHTREEWVEIDSLLPGMKFVLELILDYFPEKVRNGH